jgi:hypothetical protein
MPPRALPKSDAMRTEAQKKPYLFTCVMCRNRYEEILTVKCDHRYCEPCYIRRIVEGSTLRHLKLNEVPCIVENCDENLFEDGIVENILQDNKIQCPKCGGNSIECEEETLRCRMCSLLFNKLKLRKNTRGDK